MVNFVELRWKKFQNFDQFLGSKSAIPAALTRPVPKHRCHHSCSHLRSHQLPRFTLMRAAQARYITNSILMFCILFRAINTSPYSVLQAFFWGLFCLYSNLSGWSRCLAELVIPKRVARWGFPIQLRMPTNADRVLQMPKNISPEAF